MCYSLWYNAPTMLPATGQTVCYSLWYNAPMMYWPATSWVHYTTSCNTQSSAPEDGQKKLPETCFADWNY